MFWDLRSAAGTPELRQSSQNLRRRGLGSVWPRIGFVALLCLSGIPGDAHGGVFVAACSWDPLGFGVRGADPGAFPLLPAGPAESAAGRADTAGPRGPKNRGGSEDGTGMGQGLGWDISENHPSGDQAEGSSQKFPPCSAEAVLPPSSGVLAQG